MESASFRDETTEMMMGEVDGGDVLSKFVPRGGDRVYSSPKGKEKERDGCTAGMRLSLCWGEVLTLHRGMIERMVIVSRRDGCVI